MFNAGTAYTPRAAKVDDADADDGTGVICPLCSLPGDSLLGVAGGDFGGGVVLTSAPSFSGEWRVGVDVVDNAVAVVSGNWNTGMDFRRSERLAIVPGGVWT
jgi:hypothetical protein